jgi:hypothetical protein
MLCYFTPSRGGWSFTAHLPEVCETPLDTHTDTSKKKDENQHDLRAPHADTLPAEPSANWHWQLV